MSYELKDKVDKIMSYFPPSVEKLKASQKYNLPYIQYNGDDIKRLQAEFAKMSCEVIKLEYTKDKNTDYTKFHRGGILGRYLSDCSYPILYQNWHRFMCIDDAFREWEQPYHANQNYIDNGSITKINDIYPEIVSHMREIRLNEILGK
jgi:hypothetical protein